MDWPRSRAPRRWDASGAISPAKWAATRPAARYRRNRHVADPLRQSASVHCTQPGAEGVGTLLLGFRVRLGAAAVGRGAVERLLPFSKSPGRGFATSTPTSSSDDSSPSSSCGAVFSFASALPSFRSWLAECAAVIASSTAGNGIDGEAPCRAPFVLACCNAWTTSG